MSIQAVIFDADGVLVFPDRFAEHLSREHEITQEATQAFFQHKFTDCILGKANLSAMLPPYLAQWGWQGSAEEFMQLWFSVEDAVDVRVMEAVKSARNAGFVCGLASNQEEHRAKYMREVMDFSGQFDALFFSCEMGVKKPDARFYAAVEAALGLSGEQIAFWDDSPSHVDAAKQRGWQAELYTDCDDFERQMAQLLGTQTKN
jgi:putative hydrolase of the HAD superfamily